MEKIIYDVFAETARNMKTTYKLEFNCTLFQYIMFSTQSSWMGYMSQLRDSMPSYGSYMLPWQNVALYSSIASFENEDNGSVSSRFQAITLKQKNSGRKWHRSSMTPQFDRTFSMLYEPSKKNWLYLI
jgi:hypothetical protein